MNRIISTFLIALALAACGGGGSDEPASPSVVVLSEHRTTAGSVSSANSVQQAVLKSTYQNNSNQSVKLRIVANVVGLQAVPVGNVDHAVLFLNITSGPIPLASKIMLSATGSKQDGNIVFDTNIAPGLTVDVKLDALLIAKNGNASMSWDSMFLQLQDGK
jgi:hypothetical protein